MCSSNDTYVYDTVTLTSTFRIQWKLGNNRSEFAANLVKTVDVREDILHVVQRRV